MSNDTKAAITLVVAAFLILGMVIWSSAEPNIQPNVVSGFFTLAAAGLAGFVVFWQLRKQAENTDRANRRIEAMKLKKEIYDEILKISAEAWLHRSEFRSFIISFRSSLTEAYLHRHGHWSIPSERLGDLSGKIDALEAALDGLRTITDNWEIIDEQMPVFREALEDIRREIGAVTRSYFAATLLQFPHPRKGERDDRWKPPQIEDLEQVFHETEDLEDALDKLGGWIVTFEQDMQNALLGELFNRKVMTRTPVKRDHVVFESEGAIALGEYFKSRRQSPAGVADDGPSL